MPRVLRTPTGDDAERPAPLAGCVLDVTFLAAQTFGDRRLERDLLDLFVSQARRQRARLPLLDSAQQSEVAHLLKGSCQGIGAWEAASAAQQFDDSAKEARPACLGRLLEALDAADAAIRAHLASL